MADVETWALILAAGEGSRLRALTTRPCGTAVPKQFCSLKGGSTLLGDAIARAKAITSAAHIRAIVAEQRRSWWTSPLALAPETDQAFKAFSRQVFSDGALPRCARAPRSLTRRWRSKRSDPALHTRDHTHRPRHSGPCAKAGA